MTCRVLSGVSDSSSDRDDDTTAARLTSALSFSEKTMSREDCSGYVLSTTSSTAIRTAKYPANLSWTLFFSFRLLVCSMSYCSAK